MAYHINAEDFSLDDLCQRIEATDLVPSRACLLDGIHLNMKAFEAQGITTLAGLRNELKNTRRMEALAKTTGIDLQYLVLLRREVEGYFPAPAALKIFDWLPESEIARLEKMGIGDTAALFEAANTSDARAELLKLSGVDAAVLEELAQLADLMRVQWVSPTVARMLHEAGHSSAASVAAADAGELCEAVARVNEGNRFFKGKIGLRDIQRLVHAAGYVPKNR